MTASPYELNEIVERKPASVRDARAEGLAQQFLHSPYAGTAYMQWTLDRRLERFLQLRGLTGGDIYDAVLDRVMRQIGIKRRPVRGSDAAS